MISLCNNAPSHSLLQLYLSLVRPHLDYASAMWSPHMKKDKVALEYVQKFACCMATKSWDNGYEDLLDLVDFLHWSVGDLKPGYVSCTRSSTNCVTLMMAFLFPVPLLLIMYLTNRPFAHTNSYFYSLILYHTLYYFFVEQLLHWFVHPLSLHLNVIYTFINVTDN